MKLSTIPLLRASMLAILLVSPGAQGEVTLTTLVSFDGTNGAAPSSMLVQSADGNFYGTTLSGGTNGYGTIFHMTPAGALTTLVSFSSTNGAGPRSGLVQGTDGNLYGTTYAGGTNGYGTIFKLTTNATLVTLLSFGYTNGAYPIAGLVQGSDGNFYGTTVVGGSNLAGTAFQLITNGTLTTFVSFAYNSFDGYSPYVGLVQGKDGNLYGATFQGGTNGFGTIFTLGTNGAFRSLHSFTGGSDGANPYAGLIQGADDNLYGTTFYGGTSGYGTVFKLATNGILTTLVSFGNTNGANPKAGLVQSADGNFYGLTTSYEGASGSGYGTVFRLTTNGVLTTLIWFNGTNGASPQAGLVQGADGNFYGTTANGGASGKGTIFRLSLLAPPPPMFQMVTRTGSMLTLPWSAMSGQVYQVQYKTDLNQINWSNLSSAITTTNATAAIIDAIGPDSQRFYRVVLSP